MLVEVPQVYIYMYFRVCMYIYIKEHKDTGVSDSDVLVYVTAG